MRIQYILHADFEQPGIIDTWAKINQHNTHICRPFANETLPDPKSFDFLILMGGPQSTLEIDKFPYLQDEIDLIKKAVEAGIPVMGFCLGAQLIGTAFGGRTERSPYKEVGVFPIQLTSDGREDPLLKDLPSQLSVVHWHGEMPGLTKESKILAYSEGCPRQIIRYSPKAYGFQCHLEATMQNIEAMIHHCPEDLQNGKYIQSDKEFLANDFEPINNIMVHILDRLFAKEDLLV